MRTAVCFSGQPRFYDIGYKTIYKNLIEPNNADIFMHVWHDPELVGQRYDGAPWNATYTDFYNNETIAKLIKLYKPVKTMVQKPRKWVGLRDYSGNQAKTPTHVTFSMFYSILIANMLKMSYEQEEQFTYDCVVRCRYDLNLSTLLKVEDYDLNMVHSCNHLMECQHNSVPDILLFGNSQLMDTLCDVIYHLDEYWARDGQMMVNEGMLHMHLKKNNIISNRAPIEVEVIRNRDG